MTKLYNNYLQFNPNRHFFSHSAQILKTFIPLS